MVAVIQSDGQDRAGRGRRLVPFCHHKTFRLYRHRSLQVNTRFATFHAAMAQQAKDPTEHRVTHVVFCVKNGKSPASFLGRDLAQFV